MDPVAVVKLNCIIGDQDRSSSFDSILFWNQNPIYKLELCLTMTFIKYSVEDLDRQPVFLPIGLRIQIPRIEEQFCCASP